VRLSPLGTSATAWPIVPAPDDRWWWMWTSRWNENWQGKPKCSEKTYPSTTFSTTNPRCPDLESNPGRRGGEPATNRLSYVTAVEYLDMKFFLFSYVELVLKFVRPFKLHSVYIVWGQLRFFFNVKASGTYLSFCVVLGHYLSLPFTVLTLVGFSSLSLHWPPFVL
jgi:hypothetical protein